MDNCQRIKALIESLKSFLPSPDSGDAAVPSSSGVVVQSSSSLLDCIFRVFAQSGNGSAAHRDVSVDANTALTAYLADLFHTLSQLGEALASSLPPSFVLSIMQLRTIYSAIELAWMLGLQPSVAQLAQFQLQRVPLPTSMLLPKTCLTEAEALMTNIVDLSLLSARFDVWCSLITVELLGGMMLPRNFDRFLLTLFVFIHKSSLVSLERQYSTMLQDIMTNDRYKSLLVNKLRSFTTGPAWLRQASTSVLRQVLISPGGVLAVLIGYLDGMTDSPHLQALQSQVAKMIASPPRGQQAEDYYALLAPQVSDLLHKAVRSNDPTLLSHLSALVQQMTQLHPAPTTACLLRPLLAPLTAISTALAADRPPLPSSQDLDASLRVLVSLVPAMPSLPSLLGHALHTLHVPTALLAIYAALFQETQPAPHALLSPSPPRALVDALSELENVLDAVLLGSDPTETTACLLAFLVDTAPARLAVDPATVRLTPLPRLSGAAPSPPPLASPQQLLEARRQAAAAHEDEDDEDKAELCALDRLLEGMTGEARLATAATQRCTALLSFFSRREGGRGAAASMLLAGLLSSLLAAVLQAEPIALPTPRDEDRLLRGAVVAQLLRSPLAVEAVVHCQGAAVLRLLHTVLAATVQRPRDADPHLADQPSDPSLDRVGAVVQDVCPPGDDGPREGPGRGDDVCAQALGLLAVVVSSQQLAGPLHGLDGDVRSGLLGLLPLLHVLGLRGDDHADTAREVAQAVLQLCLPDTDTAASPPAAPARRPPDDFVDEVRAIERRWLSPALPGGEGGEAAAALAAYGLHQLGVLVAAHRPLLDVHLDDVLAAVLPLLEATDAYLHLAALASLERLARQGQGLRLLAVGVLVVGDLHAVHVFDRTAWEHHMLGEGGGQPSPSPSPLPSRQGEEEEAWQALVAAVGLPGVGRGLPRTARLRSLVGELVQRLVVHPVDARDLSGKVSAARRYIVQGLVAVCVRMSRQRVAQLPRDVSLELARGLLPRAQDRGDVSTLQAVEQVYLRQTALALLGQAVVYLRHTARHEGCGLPGTVSAAGQNYLWDVLDVALGILHMETAYSATDIAARRSAIFLLRCVVDGQSADLFAGRAEAISHLTSILRQAKRGLQDTDARVRGHAQALMDALRECTAAYLGLQEEEEEKSVLRL